MSASGPSGPLVYGACYKGAEPGQIMKVAGLICFCTCS